MVLITALPAEVWRQPATDATYSGFDSNLMYASGGGAGSVSVTRDSVAMASGAQSLATLNLLTTPLDHLSGSIDVTVRANAGATTPFRLGLWSPIDSVGYFVEFGQAPDDFVTVEGISNGTTDRTLLDGETSNVTYIGPYSTGTSYRIAFSLDRAAGVVAFHITDLAAGVTKVATVTLSQFPALFDTARFALTASTEGATGSAQVQLDRWSLTFPHQRFWAVRIDDPLANTALVALAAAGAILLLAAVAMALRRRRPGSTPWIRVPARLWPWAAAAFIVYLAGNALLFQLGGHPFDMGDEKLYAYVSRAYGTSQLFYLPNAVSLARVWGGTPYVEFAFPYEPPMAYLFAGIGFLNSALLSGGGLFRLDSVSLEYMIKAVNVLFGLGDAVLIFAILRRVGVNQRWSIAGAAFFLFNPAVWFSMSVWGQTHVISIFFVLMAILMAELDLPVWAWLSLATACLTRPQMLVFGLVLGVVFLRRFGGRRSLRAISLTVVVAFLAMLPLTLVTSPSLPVDIMLNNFSVQEGAGGASLVPVSQDAYSVWPLVTYVLQGASGTSRALTPSSDVIAGWLTYQRAAQILTAIALLAVVIALALRRRTELDRGGYIPLVAVAITSFLMFLTGIVATHFLLALPLLLLCRRWMSGIAYFYVAIVWTITTFVPMFGDMGLFISAQDYPLLAASRNAVTQFFLNLYQWDRFITVAVAANVCALAWLAVAAFRRNPTGKAESADLDPSPVGS